MNRGYSLIEVTLVLLIVGMTGSALGPSLLGWRDAAAANAAREIVVEALATTRVMSLGRGDASLELLPPSALRVVRGGDVVDSLSMDPLGASFALSGGQASTRINFDALGLGRVASRTITVVVGRAEAQLVVSTFGRVRRR